MSFGTEVVKIINSVVKIAHVKIADPGIILCQVCRLGDSIVINDLQKTGVCSIAVKGQVKRITVEKPFSHKHLLRCFLFERIIIPTFDAYKNKHDDNDGQE